jgi:hypothetical protein
MSQIPVTFALRGVELVHINDVANGLACDCVCPGCGDRMVAKQGAITIHHFAHEGGSDCAGGLQTTLHLAAKAVLSKERRMVLPALTLTATAHDTQGVAHTVFVEAFPPRPVVFDEVTEEKRLGDIIPDLICKTGGRSLLVEIAVTHFVDEIKREKIRALGVACVEIDLSTMVSVWNWDTLKNAVVDGIAYKVWIENPTINDLRIDLQRQAQEKAAIADQDNLITRRMSIPKLDWTIRQFEEFEKSGKAQQERKALNEAGPKGKAWLASAEVMKLEWDNPPNYINIPVPGESAFLVARKVWQATLYMYLIAGNANDVIFSVKVAMWCRKTFPVRTSGAGATCRECRHPHQDRLSQLPRHRHHRIPAQRRQAGNRAADGQS